MPVTAMYNMAMQDLNNLSYITSDQHRETTDARLNRIYMIYKDIHDLAKINSRLIPFTPLSEDRSLRNSVTGIEAPSDTNVHEYKAVGMNIINTMVSQAALDSYGSIAQSYADFTIRHYGLATVVFDGYGGPSIKDNTHQRRGMNVHRVVHFSADTEFIGKKEQFLSRASNKERFISAQLRNRDCNVINIPGDACYCQPTPPCLLGGVRVR